MDEDIIRQLLQADRLMSFCLIIWKNQILDDTWKSNKDILEHYNYLRANLPIEEDLASGICIELKKHSD